MGDVQKLVSESFALEGLEENVVWRDHVGPALAHLPDNVRTICHYGVTEIVNNAMDHSGGTTVWVWITQTARRIMIQVGDDGVGIFRRMAESSVIADPEQAVLELAKGGFTTMPERHTGEGIFFCSHAFDDVWILSEGFSFTTSAGQEPQIKPTQPTADWKTLVQLDITIDSSRDLAEVFDRFAGSGDPPGFRRTSVPLRLAQTNGDALIARSQAKRLLSRLDQFERVELDFEGVAMIGQAFADQVFRVFVLAHPDVEVTVRNASPQIEQMIRCAKARS